MNILDIDMASEGTQEMRIVRNNPAVINHIFYVLVPNLACISPFCWGSPPVVWIPVIVNNCTCPEWPGKVSLAFATLATP